MASPVAAAMLEALAARLGLPLDVPFAELSGLATRPLFEGTGDAWIDVPSFGFAFQFCGMETACEEAARLVVALRGRVDAVMGEVPCSECGGSRLEEVATAVTLFGRTLDVWCRMPLGRLAEELAAISLTEQERAIATDLLRELRSRVEFLVDVGLDYLDLARPAGSLSGGELQRIRLAAQVGSGLTGVLYVLDEPTIGLHPRDTHRLIRAMGKLRDLGNTLVVVEHDRDVVNAADTAIDFGPGSGREGGTVVAQAAPATLARNPQSITGPFLATQRAHAQAMAAKNHTRREPAGWLTVEGIRHRTLRDLNVSFPLGVFTAVTGPSGSGRPRSCSMCSPRPSPAGCMQPVSSPGPTSRSAASKMSIR